MGIADDDDECHLNYVFVMKHVKAPALWPQLNVKNRTTHESRSGGSFVENYVGVCSLLNAFLVSFLVVFPASRTVLVVVLHST